MSGLILVSEVLNQEDGKGVIQLPTVSPDLGPVDYPSTTDYHWPQFDLNATGVHKGFSTEPGPRLFQNGVHLEKDKEQCLVDADFVSAGDRCVVNPELCAEGLTFSVFYHADYSESPEEMLDPSRSFEREYIVSSGGDVGSPGFAIWRRGSKLGALVSTGNLTWEVEVEGATPERHTWTNLAVMWEPLRVATNAELTAAVREGRGTLNMVGGLQFLVDLEVVGHIIQPHVLGCQFSLERGNFDCLENRPAVSEPFDPPQIALGCHRTKSRPEHRLFGQGTFDELALWTRKLSQSEKPYLLGGYKYEFEDLDMKELLDVLKFINTSDASQTQTGISFFGSVVAGGGHNPLHGDTSFRNIYPETTPSPFDDDGHEVHRGNDKQKADKLNQAANGLLQGEKKESPLQSDSSSEQTVPDLMGVAEKFTDISALDPLIPDREFGIRVSVAAPVGDVSSLKGQYRDEWQRLTRNQSNFKGAHDTRVRLKKYLEYITERKEHSEWFGPEFSNVIGGDNYAAQLFRLKSANFRRLHEHRQKRSVDRFVEEKKDDQYFQFPQWNTHGDWRKVRERWESPHETIEVPTQLFSGECKTRDVSFVGEIYDTFPDPGRKNPSSILADTVVLETRIISISISSNDLDLAQKRYGVEGLNRGRCEVDEKKLRRTPVKIPFPMLSHRHNFGRNLLALFGEEDELRHLGKRHCVVWNDEFGEHGAWDTDGVELVYEDDHVVTCHATKLGAFAVVAEIRQPPQRRDDDEQWLKITKIVGLSLSILALLAFVLMVYSFSYLWEMFHVTANCLALSLLFLLVASIFGELEFVQESRELCFASGLALSYFAVAAASFSLMLAHAFFRAITAGVIGGRTGVYFLFGWGIPGVCVGINLYKNFMLMGTDPHCHVGWEAAVKWPFYGPVIAQSLMAVVLMAIVLCNLPTPALRKESILLDLSLMSKGMAAFSVYFAATWCIAPLAFIHFPDQELADFYPAFSVTNAFVGLVFAVLVALASRRVRAVLAGGHDRPQRVVAFVKRDDDLKPSK